MTDIDALYAAEVKQADLDHHKPTAGAMTGHILTNMWQLEVKLHHVAWFAKGPDALALAPLLKDAIAQNRQDIDELGALLLDENQLPPATLAEISAYGKLEEDPKLKYQPVATMVATLAKDLTFADMFIDRAIKLAERENRPAMAAWLTALRGRYNHLVQQLQAFIGKTAWEDLVEEDDDEDDD